MFIIIDNDHCFAPVTYPIDTPEQERRARIALAAAGLENATVWVGPTNSPKAFQSRRRLYAANHPADHDDEVTAVYTPSPELLRAATR